jgi:hypothetical protein
VSPSQSPDTAVVDDSLKKIQTFLAQTMFAVYNQEIAEQNHVYNSLRYLSCIHTSGEFTLERNINIGIPDAESAPSGALLTSSIRGLIKVVENRTGVAVCRIGYSGVVFGCEFEDLYPIFAENMNKRTDQVSGFTIRGPQVCMHNHPTQKIPESVYCHQFDSSCTGNILNSIGSEQIIGQNHNKEPVQYSTRYSIEIRFN